VAPRERETCQDLLVEVRIWPSSFKVLDPDTAYVQRNLRRSHHSESAEVVEALAEMNWLLAGTKADLFVTVVYRRLELRLDDDVGDLDDILGRLPTDLTAGPGKSEEILRTTAVDRSATNVDFNQCTVGVSRMVRWLAKVDRAGLLYVEVFLLTIARAGIPCSVAHRVVYSRAIDPCQKPLERRNR